jgi:hypothetical protein
MIPRPRLPGAAGAVAQAHTTSPNPAISNPITSSRFISVAFL